MPHRISHRRAFFAIGVFSLTAGPSLLAQSFNIDFASGFGTPPDDYVCAAFQPGFYNSIGSLGTAPVALKNLAGVDTSVTLAADDFYPGSGFAHPLTTGGDEQFFDDWFDLGGVGATATFTVSGLTPGEYTVYTYAWATDSPGYRTEVRVNFANPQEIGGSWNSGLGPQQGAQYAFHEVVLTEGADLLIDCKAVVGFATSNGIQIVGRPSVPPDCPADLDGDGAVGLGDLGQLLQSYNVDAGGDIDGDGDTDLGDLGALLQAYGTPCP